LLLILKIIIMIKSKSGNVKCLKHLPKIISKLLIMQIIIILLILILIYYFFFNDCNCNINENFEQIKKQDIKVEQVKKQDIKVDKQVKKQDIKVEQAKKQDKQVKKQDIKVEQAKKQDKQVKKQDKKVKKQDIKVEQVKKQDIKVEQVKKQDIKVEQVKKQEKQNKKQIKQVEYEIKSEILFPKEKPKDAFLEYRERQLLVKKQCNKPSTLDYPEILEVNMKNNKKITPSAQIEARKIINKNKRINSENIVKDYDENLKIDNILAPLLDVLPVIKNTDSTGKTHIDLLPKMRVPMKMDLVTNTNFIINTGNEIYQDILQTESNKSYIFNIRYNFMQVSWVLSSLLWFCNDIKLEMRITNVNPDDGKKVQIVFPLMLTKIPENFSDTYFDFDLNNFKSELKSSPYKFGDTKKGLIYPVSTECENKKLLIEKVKNKYNKVIAEEEIRKIDDNTMIKEIQRETALLNNQMLDGIMRPVTETKYFKKNRVYSKGKDFHPISKVKNALKNLNYDKINIKSIPKSTDLSNFSNILKANNFNTVTDKINNVKYSDKDAETILNLNSLLVDHNLIPEYICCTPITGELLTFDFKKLQEKILAQDSFYYTSANDGSLIFITQPQPFDEIIGNTIIKNLTDK